MFSGASYAGYEGYTSYYDPVAALCSSSDYCTGEYTEVVELRCAPGDPSSLLLRLDNFPTQICVIINQLTGVYSEYTSPLRTHFDAMIGTITDLDGEPLADPRTLRFTTGMRRKCWVKNVVAIGLASGFIEPLESTSIHLVQTAVTRLLDLLPSGEISEAQRDEYNERAAFEASRIRDFIILHYHVTEREEPFWRDCRTMSVPESLARRISMFRQRAHAWQADSELFRVDSWMQVMLGQGIRPQNYHHLTKAMSQQDLARFLNGLRASINRTVERLPNHQQFVDEYCRTSSDVWEMARPKVTA